MIMCCCYVVVLCVCVFVVRLCVCVCMKGRRPERCFIGQESNNK